MRAISPTIKEDHLCGMSQKKNSSRLLTSKVLVLDLKGTRSLKKVLTGNTKATFNQAALDIGMCSVDNSNTKLPEMTKNIYF